MPGRSGVPKCEVEDCRRGSPGYISGYDPQLYPKAARNPQTPASSAASVGALRRAQVAPHLRTGPDKEEFDPPFYREDQLESLRKRNQIAYQIASASVHGTMKEYKHEMLEQRRKDAAEFHAAGLKRRHKDAE